MTTVWFDTNKKSSFYKFTRIKPETSPTHAMIDFDSKDC